MKSKLICCILIIMLLFSGCEASTDKKSNSEEKLTSSSIMQQDLNGNVVSGGYVAEHGGFIYFVNQDDQNRLYRMDEDGNDKIKLSDKANTSPRLNIQFENNQLFYLQSSGVAQNCIYTLYSYNLIQNVETMLSDKNICSYALQQDFIYFTTMEPKENDQNGDVVYWESKVFKMRIDGSGIEFMDGDCSDLAFVQITNDKLYIGHHESISKKDLDGVSEKVWYANPFLFHAYNESLYYIPFNKSSIYKANLNDNNFDGNLLIDKKGISSFAIYQNTIYFSTFDKKIYKTDLNGNDPQFIVEGMYPIILSKYLFYYNMEDKIVSISK